MVEEILPTIDAPGIVAVGKFQTVVGKGCVDRRRAHFHNLKRGGAFKYAVANLRRLDDEVAFAHHERLALVLVNNTHPPVPDIDELQRDLVVVDQSETGPPSG